VLISVLAPEFSLEAVNGKTDDLAVYITGILLA
jgi:hypothetical protein